MKDQISAVLDNQDAIARRDFCARANEQTEDEDEGLEETSKRGNFTYDYEPEEFAGLHPNHVKHAKAQLGYHEDSVSLSFIR